MPETVATAAIMPPIARRDPTPTTLHGQTLPDDYRWMRNKSSAETVAYLEAENEYTTAVMKPTEQLQEFDLILCGTTQGPGSKRESHLPSFRSLCPRNHQLIRSLVLPAAAH